MSENVAGGRLALVEDNVDLRDILVSRLRRRGVEVEAFGRADEALKAIREGAIDVDCIVSDIALPGAMNGADLADSISDVRPDLRVVLMTGNLSDPVLAARVRDRQYEVLLKPFELPELLQILAAAISARKR
jgi:two-component system C4-dicarboxylate transport response regulator DctD